MGEVVDLAQKRLEREIRDLQGPHYCVEVICEQCMHEWLAILPVACRGKLQCPSCTNMTGLWEVPGEQ